MFDSESVISGEYLITDKPKTLALTSVYLEKLHPRNAIIIVKHRGFSGKTKQSEPWYGTNYNEIRYTDEQNARWTTAFEGLSVTDADFGQLKLPEPNPFLPTDFSLKGDAEEVDSVVARHSPVLIENVLVAHVEEISKALSTGDLQADAAGAVVEEEEGEEVPETNEDEQEEGEKAEEGGPSAGPTAMKPIPGRVRMTWLKQVRSSAKYTNGVCAVTESPFPTALGKCRIVTALLWCPLLPSLSLWYLCGEQDFKWKVPKANVTVKIETLQVRVTATVCTPLQHHFDTFMPTA